MIFPEQGRESGFVGDIGGNRGVSDRVERRGAVQNGEVRRGKERREREEVR